LAGRSSPWGWHGSRPSCGGPTSAIGNKGWRQKSGVFSLFNASYFMAELLEARLWERLEAARGAGRTADDPSSDTTSDLWLEAETMRAVVSAGAAEAQPLDDALLGTWRNQQQLRWHRARPGAELALPFETTEPGTYRVSVRFTRAPTYAIVAIRLDDGPASLDRVSLYAPPMAAADPLSMGEHALAPGAHRLRFTIVGAHPQAEPVTSSASTPSGSSACDKGTTGWAAPPGPKTSRWYPG
jgi:hypothetical protein